MDDFRPGDTVECTAESIQRTSGAAWRGDRGRVEAVSLGDRRITVRWHHGATTESVDWSDVRCVRHA